MIIGEELRGTALYKIKGGTVTVVVSGIGYWSAVPNGHWIVEEIRTILFAIFHFDEENVVMEPCLGGWHDTEIRKKIKPKDFFWTPIQSN